MGHLSYVCDAVRGIGRLWPGSEQGYVGCGSSVSRDPIGVRFRPE